MTHRELQRQVRREIKEAMCDGRAWTAPRPFLNWMEMVGKARCSPSPRPKKCKRVAKYVSYSTKINGCVVYCEHCVKRAS